MKKLLPYLVVGSPSHPILKPVKNSKVDKNAVTEKELCKTFTLSHSTAFRHYQEYNYHV